MSKAKFTIKHSDRRLDITFTGVFTIEDSKRYELAVLEACQVLSHKWVLVADVTELMPSTLEAVEYIQGVTRKLYESGCQAIITITSDKDAVVKYQVEKAAGEDFVHFTDSMEGANAILASIDL